MSEKIPFFKYGDNPSAPQQFDKDKITVTKAGKTYNQYDFIQKANIDTDIYDVIKKYNLQQDEAVILMQERGGVKGIYADLTEFQQNCIRTGDLAAYTERAQIMFEQLPAEVKTKYGNDLTKFFSEVKKEIETEKKEVTKEVTKDEPKQD